MTIHRSSLTRCGAIALCAVTLALAGVAQAADYGGNSTYPTDPPQGGTAQPSTGNDSSGGDQSGTTSTSKKKHKSHDYGSPTTTSPSGSSSSRLPGSDSGGGVTPHQPGGAMDDNGMQR